MLANAPTAFYVLALITRCGSSVAEDIKGPPPIKSNAVDSEHFRSSNLSSLASYELRGWREVFARHSPEMAAGSRYLFTARPGMYQMALDKVVPESAVVTGMKISLEYYTAYEDLDDDGQPPVYVSLRACWYAEKVVAQENFTNGQGWQMVEFVAEKGSSFDFTLRRCLNDVLVNVRVGAKRGVFVALRNVVVEYSTPDGELFRTCSDPRACAFRWASGEKLSWSRQGIHGLDGLNYWTPTKNRDVLALKFKNLVPTSDANITLTYVVTEGVKILMSGNGTYSASVLTRTSDADGKDVVWIQFRFKLSDIFPKMSNRSEATLLLTSDYVDFEANLAMVGVRLDVRVFNRKAPIWDTATDVLIGWSQQDARLKSQWHFLPDTRISRPANSSMVIFRSAPNLGTAYVYSDWFKVNAKVGTMVLRYTVKRPLDAKDIQVAARLVSHDLRTMNEFVLKIAPGQAMTDQIKIKYPASVHGDLQRIVFKFVYTANATGLMAITDVSFGDACNPSPCHHGTCGRYNTNKYYCRCPAHKRGVNCHLDDFCGQVFFELNGTSQLGDQLCAAGGAIRCESHEHRDDPRPFECICDKNQFWDSALLKCSKFNDCQRVSRCLLDNTRCVEPDGTRVFEAGNPCPLCIVGYKRADYKDRKSHCVRMDPCVNCGEALCAVVTSKEEDEPPLGVCHCPKGFELSNDGDSQICKMKSERCPDIVRTSHGCDQDCEWAYKSGHSTISCTCMASWSWNSLNRRCELNEASSCGSNKCPDDQICTTVKKVATCVCRPGFFKDLVTGKCSLDFCTAAQNRTDLMAEIKSVCGDGIDSCSMVTSKNLTIKFFCNCGQGYRVDEGTGQCLIDDPCRKGSQQRNDCEKNKMICKRKMSKNSSGHVHPVHTCECPAGQTFDPWRQKCSPQCEVKDNVIECLKSNKVCKVDYRSANGSCVCLPGFLDISGHCTLAEYVYVTPQLHVSLPSNLYLSLQEPRFKKWTIRNEKKATIELSRMSMFEDCVQSPDPQGCVDYVGLIQQQDVYHEPFVAQDEKNTVRKIISRSFAIVFHAFEGYVSGGLSLMNYSKAGDNLYYVTAAVVFGTKLDNSKWMGHLATRCLKTKSLNAYTCVLPGGLSVSIPTIVTKEKVVVKGSVLNACDETRKGRAYCPENSKCHLFNERSSKKFPFMCACPEEGFSLEMIVPFDFNEPIRRKEICVDIDECKLPKDATRACPEGSICTNTIGSRTCSCPDGQTMVDKGCVSVCDGIKCNHGHCTVHPRAPATWQCTCSKGWHGETCDIKDLIGVAQKEEDRKRSTTKPTPLTTTAPKVSQAGVDRLAEEEELAQRLAAFPKSYEQAEAPGDYFN